MRCEMLSGMSVTLNKATPRATYLFLFISTLTVVCDIVLTGVTVQFSCCGVRVANLELLYLEKARSMSQTEQLKLSVVKRNK